MIEQLSEAESACLSDALHSESRLATEALLPTTCIPQHSSYASKSCRQAHLLSLYFTERASLLGTLTLLLRLAANLGLDGAINNSGPATEDLSVVDSVRAVAHEVTRHCLTPSNLSQYAEDNMSSLERCIEELESDLVCTIEEDYKAYVRQHWARATVLRTIYLMESIAVCAAYSETRLSNVLLCKWFQCMNSCGFFASYSGFDNLESSILENLQLTATTTCLIILKPASIVRQLLEDNSTVNDIHQRHDAGFLDVGTIKEIHGIMLNAIRFQAATAILTVSAWGVILYAIRDVAQSLKDNREHKALPRLVDSSSFTDRARRSSSSSTGSIQHSAPEEVLETLSQHFEDDTVQLCIDFTFEDGRIFSGLSVVATALQASPVFGMTEKIRALQDLIRIAAPIAGYSGEMLGAAVDVLRSASSEVEIPRSESYSSLGDLFVGDDVLKTMLLETSLARFPYESITALQLLRGLMASSHPTQPGFEFVMTRLYTMHGFTHSATGNLAKFHTVHEEENMNLVGLKSDALMVYGGTSSMLPTSKSETAYSDLAIRKGTEGTVISETTPTVVLWHHDFSAFRLFGSWIDLYRSGVLDLSLDSIDSSVEVIAQVLHLLGELVAKESAHGRMENVLSVLDEVTGHAQYTSDIISTILDICQMEMSSLRLIQSSASCEVVTACLKLMTALCSIFADRVWLAIPQDFFLDGFLLDSVLSSDLRASGNLSMDFFEAYMTLYESLLHTAIATSRPQHPNRQQSRNATFQSFVPGTLIAERLSAFTERICEFTYHMLDLPEALSIRGIIILKTCMASIQTILMLGRISTNEKGPSESPRHLLTPSALIITQKFTSVFEGSRMPLTIRVLVHLIKLKASQPRNASALCETIVSTLQLITSLLRANRVDSSKDTTFEVHTMKLSPIFVRLIGPNSVGIASMGLLETLLQGAHRIGPDISLLSRLGPDSALLLCQNLQSIACNSTEPQGAASAWNLIATLYRGQQQWFAIQLLTGSNAQSVRAPSSNSINNDHRRHNKQPVSVFTTATQLLMDINNLSPDVAAAILSAVVTALQNWSWAQSQMDLSSDFYNVIFKHVAQMTTPLTPTTIEPHNLEIAAHTCHIAVIYLHKARALKDNGKVKMLIPLITWLDKCAVEFNAFNRSLHANLERNVVSKYSPWTLSELKHTSISDRVFGENFVYDIDLARLAMGVRSREDPFLAELIRANVNLSVVQAQLDLFHAFKELCVEQGGFLMQNQLVQKVMVDIIRKCLLANAGPLPQEALFEGLLQSRQELVLGLFRALVGANARGINSLSLLDVVWRSIDAHDSSYENAISSAYIPMFRCQISILLLALQLRVQKVDKDNHENSPAKAKGTSSLAVSIPLEIAQKIVVNGLVALVAAVGQRPQSIHEVSTIVNIDDVGFEDFELILSVLRTILRLPSVPQMVSQLSAILVSAEFVQSCTSLYSWSHTLVTSNQNPVFGDLSLRILACASILPGVAEGLAVEGILTRISTARMTHFLRSQPGGVSHYDGHEAIRTLYRTWSQAILPLCLNLLVYVGRPMSAEVAVFLNQFPEQLLRASDAFAGSDTENNLAVVSITLNLAQEAATLAMISHILQSYRLAGASAGVNTLEISPLQHYDDRSSDFFQDVEDILEKDHALLRSRMIASNEHEVQWMHEPSADSRSRNLLEEKVAQQLMVVWSMSTKEADD